jgi:hypothetical protein
MAKRKGQTFIQRSRGVGAAQKAQWHQVEGAGKAKAKRPFFNLTAEDVRALEERLERHLDVIVRRAG